MKYVDRFQAALFVLAGHGHIKQRLIKAYEKNLSNINEDELPIVLRQTFADLRHQMNSVTPLNGEGAVCASVRKMSFDEASELASSIVNMFSSLLRTEGGWISAQESLELTSERETAERMFWARNQFNS
ncbi:MAG: hypothetical protein CMQ54_00890 [Gammaproteobacteria bacterium]|nr:hypothetical protein [Gammaproteobacteria bacterium]